VLALAASAGALLWEYDAGLILFDRPIVADDTVYCSPAVNHPDTPMVLALDARTGTHRWSAPIPESTSAPTGAVTPSTPPLARRFGTSRFRARITTTPRLWSSTAESMAP
jgi:outer membrane protein assembly factor BamB